MLVGVLVVADVVTTFWLAWSLASLASDEATADWAELTAAARLVVFSWASV